MRPHQLRASWSRSRKRQREEESARWQRYSDDNDLRATSYRRGYRDKQREFTRLIEPERGVVFLQPPPEHDRLVVPVPDRSFEPRVDLEPRIPIHAVCGVMYFCAKRMRCEVGNGVVADFFTWEPDGFESVATEIRRRFG